MDMIPESTTPHDEHICKLIHDCISELCLCSMDTAKCLEHFSTNCGLLESDDANQIHCSLICSITEFYVKQVENEIICQNLKSIVEHIMEKLYGKVSEYLINLLFDKCKYNSYHASRSLAVWFKVSSLSTCQKLLNSLCSKWDSSNMMNCIKIIGTFNLILFNRQEEKGNGKVPFKACVNLINIKKSFNVSQHLGIASDTVDLHWEKWSLDFLTSLPMMSYDEQVLATSFITLWDVTLSLKLQNERTEWTACQRSQLSKLIDLMNLATFCENTILFMKVLDIFLKLMNHWYIHQNVKAEIVDISHYNLKNLLRVKVLESDKCYKNCSVDNCRNSTINVTVTPLQNSSTIVMHKSILLLLKSLAIYVNFNFIQIGSTAANVTVGRILVLEAFDRLHNFMKTKELCSKELVMGQSIVNLCVDQDDWLIEGMLSCLEVFLGVENIQGMDIISENFDPHLTFLSFLRVIHYDHQVLLDYLISNETCFLRYLLKYLKTLTFWHNFNRMKNHDVINILSTLSALKVSIENISSTDIFPYNIKPILKLLVQCDKFYENKKNDSLL